MTCVVWTKLFLLSIESSAPINLFGYSARCSQFDEQRSEKSQTLSGKERKEDEMEKITKSEEAQLKKGLMVLYPNHENDTFLIATAQQYFLNSLNKHNSHQHAIKEALFLMASDVDIWRKAVKAAFESPSKLNSGKRGFWHSINLLMKKVQFWN